MRNDVPVVADQSNAEELLRELLDQAENHLEPIGPEEALELYLEDKRRDCRESTVKAHRSRLGHFVNWCRDQAVNNLSDLSAKDLHEFRVWRRNGLNVVSERTQMVTLRVFLEWCGTIDAVQPGLFQKVRIPTIPHHAKARETVIHVDQAREILDYLGKYEYATAEHVTWLILVETGIRLGAAHALDVGDYRPDTEQPHLDIVHRLETGTPIKNGTRGERPVGIAPEACDIIDDYLNDRRPDVTDCYGREPLLATRHGRIAKSTLRKYAYKWSRPCKIGQECPHGRNPLDCEAGVNIDQAAQCPSSVTPHPIRRGYITQLLQSDVPVDVVSSRCNVSPDIIEKHYDVRTEEGKMRQRQRLLDKALSDES